MGPGRRSRVLAGGNRHAPGPGGRRRGVQNRLADVITSYSIHYTKLYDFIFITSPSIHTFLKREAGDPFGFEFNYLGRDERFVNLDNEDAFNHYLDGVIDMGGAGGRTDLKVGGLYTQTRESSGSEFDSNFNPRSKRFVKAGHADLLWRISQLFKATFNTRYET